MSGLQLSLLDRLRLMLLLRRSPGLRDLVGFARRRGGIEGFLEPRTPIEPPSLLVVDREGDYVRAELADDGAAFRFGRTTGIPIHEASVVGYPSRLRSRGRARRSRLRSPGLPQTRGGRGA